MQEWALVRASETSLFDYTEQLNLHHASSKFVLSAISGYLFVIFEANLSFEIIFCLVLTHRRHKSRRILNLTF
jgi:hypothetical protein